MSPSESHASARTSSNRYAGSPSRTAPKASSISPRKRASWSTPRGGRGSVRIPPRTIPCVPSRDLTSIQLARMVVHRSTNTKRPTSARTLTVANVGPDVTTHCLTPAVGSCGTRPGRFAVTRIRFATSRALPVRVAFAEATRQDTRGCRSCNTTERYKRQRTREGASAEHEGAGTLRIVDLLGHPGQAAVQTREHGGFLLSSRFATAQRHPNGARFQY